jgi:multimeric flavodoxin WrbA
MSKSILVITGSPKKDGNTAKLAGWFAEGAKAAGASVELVNAAAFKLKVNGCQSCRACQKRKEYACAFEDDVKLTLDKMAKADVIVMATPLYFFSASAQIKQIFDRMFSLYKWDNENDTMQTVLKGKIFAVIASAYEGEGFEALEEPFKMTADYSGMEYASLIVPDAGESGEVVKVPGIKAKAMAFGKVLTDMFVG